MEISIDLNGSSNEELETADEKKLVSTLRKMKQTVFYIECCTEQFSRILAMPSRRKEP